MTITADAVGGEVLLEFGDDLDFIWLTRSEARALAARILWAANEATPRDSDGSPQGRDGEAGSMRSTTARAVKDGIAQPLSEQSPSSKE